MIKVSGDTTTAEYTAALRLKEVMENAWPDVKPENSPHSIWLIAGARCFGQEVQDIDLLLLAHFEPGKSFCPSKAFAYYDRLVLPPQVEVSNLCVTIEVKDHSLDKIKIVEGNKIAVKYGAAWKNATDQSAKQIYSIKNYVKLNGLSLPYIRNLIWLRNVTAAEINNLLPVSNLIGSNVTWNGFLNALCQAAGPRYNQPVAVWDLGSDQLTPVAISKLADLFSRTVQLESTELDRRKLSRLHEISSDDSALLDKIGKQMVIVRGSGGTGKTMRLLQIAYALYQREAASILILTFNKALAADLRRLLTLSGVSLSDLERSISIQTVHSFFHAIFKELDILSATEPDFLAQYQAYKNQALEYLEGAVTEQDIQLKRDAGSPPFSWDYILIDEGQDWPQDEPQILFKLYPSERFVIADGLTQVVRAYEPTDWKGLLPKPKRVIHNLDLCMRMKAGLAQFIKDLALELGLPAQNWKPNYEMPGGKVIILEKDYLAERSLHDSLLAHNQSAHNLPIDMLFCVSPALVQTGGAAEGSLAAQKFLEWGGAVWDGASKDVRDSFPTSVEQLRIVQYDSCRGLEGWVAVNLDLDGFYENKRQLYLANPRLTQGGMQDIQSEAREYAAQWMMIPLTRAMDTLVIQLTGQAGSLRQALERTAGKWSDLVDWR